MSPCCACYGTGFMSSTAGTLAFGPVANRRDCIECDGTGKQSLEQQIIVDALNARVILREHERVREHAERRGITPAAARDFLRAAAALYDPAGRGGRLT